MITGSDLLLLNTKYTEKGHIVSDYSYAVYQHLIGAVMRLNEQRFVAIYHYIRKNAVSYLLCLLAYSQSVFKRCVSP